MIGKYFSHSFQRVALVFVLTASLSRRIFDDGPLIIYVIILNRFISSVTIQLSVCPSINEMPLFLMLCYCLLRLVHNDKLTKQNLIQPPPLDRKGRESLSSKL